MDLLPFSLVVASELSHTSWNVMAKGGEEKGAFMWLMVSTSLFTWLPVF